jgi:hypothetical protein
VGRIVRKGKTYLSVDEVCEVTGHTKERVWALGREGKLKWQKLPGIRARMFTLQSVADYLAARRMMNGLTPDNIAMTLARMETRLRRVESVLRRRNEGSLIGEPLSDPQLLVKDLDRLKNCLGIG